MGGRDDRFRSVKNSSLPASPEFLDRIFICHLVLEVSSLSRTWKLDNTATDSFICVAATLPGLPPLWVHCFTGFMALRARRNVTNSHRRVLIAQLMHYAHLKFLCNCFIWQLDELHECMYDSGYSQTNLYNDMQLCMNQILLFIDACNASIASLQTRLCDAADPRWLLCGERDELAELLLWYVPMDLSFLQRIDVCGPVWQCSRPNPGHMDVTPDALVSLRDKKVRSVFHFVCTEKISMATFCRNFCHHVFISGWLTVTRKFYTRVFRWVCFYVYMFIYIKYGGCLVHALYGACMFRNFSL